jgi:hypothetical protein
MAIETSELLVHRLWPDAGSFGGCPGSWIVNPVRE